MRRPTTTASSTAGPARATAEPGAATTITDVRAAAREADPSAATASPTADPGESAPAPGGVPRRYRRSGLDPVSRPRSSAPSTAVGPGAATPPSVPAPPHRSHRPELAPPAPTTLPPAPAGCHPRAGPEPVPPYFLAAAPVATGGVPNFFFLFNYFFSLSNTTSTFTAANVLPCDDPLFLSALDTAPARSTTVCAARVVITLCTPRSLPADSPRRSHVYFTCIFLSHHPVFCSHLHCHSRSAALPPSRYPMCMYFRCDCPGRIRSSASRSRAGSRASPVDLVGLTVEILDRMGAAAGHRCRRRVALAHTLAVNAGNPFF